MLMLVSIALTISFWILSSFLPGGTAGDHNAKAMTTIQKLQKVEEAMKGFMAMNGRRPCPADGQYDTNSKYFGIEAATPGTCTGGTPAADFSGGTVTTTGNTTLGSQIVTNIGSTSGLSVGMSVSGSGISPAAVIAGINSSSQITLTIPATATATSVSMTFTDNLVEGVIPTKTLGLPDDYAFDEFGHRFSYVVDARATALSSCNVLTQSNLHAGPSSSLLIESTTGGSVIDQPFYAYTSHGKDGHGAFPAQGSSVTKRINTGTTDTDKLTNADVNSSFVTNFTPIKVRKEPTTTFDDLVYYSDAYKNTCCLGPSCNLGFRADGVTTKALMGGNSGLDIGDVNGDGIPDIIIASSYNGTPEVAVIFGTRNGFPNPLPINALNGSNGFLLTSSSGLIGLTGLGVGDLNGDGYSDVIVSHTSSYGMYVIFGGPTRKDGTAWAASQTVQTLANGTNGIELSGNSTAGFNYNYTTADINGDKIDDLIFTSQSANTLYAVLGRSGTWSTPVDFTTLSSATTPAGFQIAVNSTMTSRPNLAMGDINGDGYADIALADSGSAPGRSDNKGVVAVIYGGPNPIGNYDLVNHPLNGSNGSYIYARGSNSCNGGSNVWCIGLYQSGMAIGDVNGDGYGDLLIGDGRGNYTVAYGGFYGGVGQGAVFIIFGHGGPWPRINDIDNLVWSGAATRIDGPSSTVTQTFPSSLAVTDANGDGYGDVAMANYYSTSPAPYGSVYLLFGHGGPWPIRSFTTNPPTGGRDAVRIDCSYVTDLETSPVTLGCGDGSAIRGLWVTSASAPSTDVNGDGIGDIIIPVPGATSAAGVSEAGDVYTIFGHRDSNWPAVFPLSWIK